MTQSVATGIVDQVSSTSAQPIYSPLARDSGLRDLVELFVSSLPQRLAQLREMAEQGDWEGLRRLAHQLKGAAGSYGFAVISVKAAQLEAAARQSADPPVILQLLAELEELSSRARSEAPPY